MGYRDYVNVIALIALMEHKDEIKKHPTYRWKVGSLYPGKSKIRYDYNWPYYSHSFADAVMSAAKIANANSHLGYVCTWVEPDESMVMEKEKEYCMWILKNNLEKKDYTTIENMCRGAKNLPLGGAVNGTYDKEYKEWIEASI